VAGELRCPYCGSTWVVPAGSGSFFLVVDEEAGATYEAWVCMKCGEWFMRRVEVVSRELEEEG